MKREAILKKVENALKSLTWMPRCRVRERQKVGTGNENRCAVTKALIHGETVWQGKATEIKPNQLNLEAQQREAPEHTSGAQHQ